MDTTNTQTRDRSLSCLLLCDLNTFQDLNKSTYGLTLICRKDLNGLCICYVYTNGCTLNLFNS